MSNSMTNNNNNTPKRPKLGLLYMDHVLRFFDRTNFRGWPDKIEIATYHWGNDKDRFIQEVKNKGIDVLIGNVPATAYETFREIARELPNVQFVPSLDTQYSNKSKENVTRFCEKYDLSIPKTYIHYDVDEGREFLESTTYPKIVKRSYGPSNYGGFFVHKVDNEAEAKALFEEKQYFPIYMQDFVPMMGDIRVMLIGHKPVCAFWRRAPEGEWLTNTSQGGSMDYQDVPAEALELAIASSKAANAEYWAADIAVSYDDEYSILECATAFAAFPYIRDWIGQYLMWEFAPEQFRKPHFADRNWEELGKIDSSLLRTMRYIQFGKPCDSTDTGELAMTDEDFALYHTKTRNAEEWPSEVWNFQDNVRKQRFEGEVSVVSSSSEADTADSEAYVYVVQDPTAIYEVELALGDEDSTSPQIQQLVTDAITKATETLSENDDLIVVEGENDLETPAETLTLTEEELFNFLISVNGIGPNQAALIMQKLGVDGANFALDEEPEMLLTVKGLKIKKQKNIMKAWKQAKETELA
ncbi:hypothetical protein N9R79_03145 [Vibrio sp.]|nr:hypothetical protein [Vibrio sp.]